MQLHSQGWSYRAQAHQMFFVPAYGIVKDYTLIEQPPVQYNTKFWREKSFGEFG